MRLTDIKAAVIEKLKVIPPGHKVYATEVLQGLEKPCFFVEVFPITNQGRQYYSEKSVMIKIIFLSLNDIYVEAMNMADTLTETFRMCLKVKDRELLLNETEIKYEDNALEFSFAVQFQEGVEVTSIGDEYMLENEKLGYSDGEIELMQELQLNEEE